MKESKSRFAHIRHIFKISVDGKPGSFLIFELWRYHDAKHIFLLTGYRHKEVRLSAIYVEDFLILTICYCADIYLRSATYEHHE